MEYHQPEVTSVYGLPNGNTLNPSVVERVRVPMTDSMISHGYEIGTINNTSKDYWFIYNKGEPVYVKSKRVETLHRHREELEEDSYTLRLFRVTSLPYERIRAFRAMCKGTNLAAVDNAKQRYPEAAGFVDLMTRNNIEFDNRLISLDTNTAEEFITYEEFVDLDELSLNSPTYVEDFDVLIVPATVPYNDLPLHPSNIKEEANPILARDGSRVVRVFDPNRTLPTRVYLSEYDVVATIPVHYTAYKHQAGVLIEYSNVVTSEGDPGKPATFFVPLEEAIIEQGNTAPNVLGKNKLWLYTTHREAVASDTQASIELAYIEAKRASAESELYTLKTSILQKEQVFKERELALKAEFSESEHSSKLHKNSVDVSKSQWQLASVVILGALTLFKALS